MFNLPQSTGPLQMKSFEKKTIYCVARVEFLPLHESVYEIFSHPSGYP